MLNLASATEPVVHGSCPGGIERIDWTPLVDLGDTLGALDLAAITAVAWRRVPAEPERHSRRTDSDSDE
jgi:hypothetical protein